MKVTEHMILGLLALCLAGVHAQGIAGVVSRSLPVGRTNIMARHRPYVPSSTNTKIMATLKEAREPAVKIVEPSITKNGCPKGFSSFADECFFENLTPKTWKSARAVCKRAGPGIDLATVNSREAYDFIRKKLGNRPVIERWIGLSKQVSGTPYTWVSGERVQYLPWNSNYTGQEPTGYVALSLNSAQFFPKSNPNVVLPFLCGTKRVPDTASAAAAAGGADAGGAAAAVGGAAAVAGGAAAAAGGANIAEQHKAVDVRAADITQVGLDTKARPEETMITCKEGWERFEEKCFKAFYEQGTFQNASLRCRQEGGELLSLHSPSQSEFVRTKLLKNSPSEDFWMGLSSGENGLQWSDGSPLDYSNWTPRMSTAQIWTPFRTLHPQRQKLLKHLEKCFLLSSESSLWENGECDDEYCFICFDDVDSPEGAAEPVTELQTSTSSTSTSPASTQETSTLRSDVFLVDPENIIGQGKPIEKLPHPHQNGLPQYLVNGLSKSAITLVNVSGINMTLRAMVAKNSPESAADSKSDDDDDQSAVTKVFEAAAAIAALAGAAICAVKLFQRCGNSPFSWTSLRSSSTENVHSLKSVHQSLRDPETCDENQRGVYGALE